MNGEPLPFPHRLSRRMDLMCYQRTVSEIVVYMLWVETRFGLPTDSLPLFALHALSILGIIPYTLASLTDPIYLHHIISYSPARYRENSLVPMIYKCVLVIFYVIRRFVWDQYAYNAWVASFAEEPAPWYKHYE
ncbi:hypothetical protein F4776DRAFT_50206 [Hypoxylon sp. NC0597]|nr:hypothetical protein F4776DRAFT_50206 [Hypoxylon sp. NC0597]